MTKNNTEQNSRDNNLYSKWAQIYVESRTKNIERLNAFNKRIGIVKKSSATKYSRNTTLHNSILPICKLVLFLISSRKKKIPSVSVLVLMEWGRYGKIDSTEKVKDFLKFINHELCNTDIYMNSDVAIFDPVLSSQARKSAYQNVFDLADVISSLKPLDYFTLIKLYFDIVINFNANGSVKNQFRSAAAIVIAKRIMKKTAPKIVIMTTSNSYMTEGLRVELLSEHQDVDVVEILHGIPTLEIDEYHKKMTQVFSGWSNIKFIPKLNNINIDPLYRCKGVSAINLTEIVVPNLVRQRVRNENAVYVGVGGGNAHESNYLESMAFKLEMLYFSIVDKWAKKNKLNIVKIYTLHPYRRTRENIEKFVEDYPSVLLLDDSVSMWKTVDIFLTVYSSSIWEAEQYGAKVWFPVKSSDDLFSDLLLGARGMAESENDVAESLMNFLDNFNKEVMQ